MDPGRGGSREADGPAALSTAGGYRFAGFALEAARGALRRSSGEEVALRPKAADVLRYLAENAGQLVSREALLEAVWPGVFVTDDSITQCVAEIRRALGSEGAGLLRTVPKRGYFLAAEVTRGELAGWRAPSHEDAAAALQARASDRDATPPVPPPASRTGTERRQLTILFCRLGGSVPGGLDPEDLRDVAAAYQLAVTAAAERQGGTVVRHLGGDWVVAHFGWPTAHEDDAERAVRAALAAAEAVAELAAGQLSRGALKACIGIATGPVVAGDLAGEGEAVGQGVVGETLGRAAALQAGAEPGTTVIDAATRRLTGALFEVTALAADAAAKDNRAGPSFRVLGESGIESRFEALRGGAARPLIGREEELELLQRRWHQANSGEGRVVLLRGEAGIGKSRLTTALREALVGEAHEEFVLDCSPQHTDSALHPVATRLERAAGLAATDAAEVRLAKLEALLTPLNPPPEDVVLVAELLSVPTLGRWVVPDLSPQRRRERLLQALVRRVRGLAARRPVLAMVEDAHWADPTTRELLDLLVPEVPGLALLLVVTHRPEFDPGAWIGLPHVSPMQLNRLTPAEHRALLYRVAGKALPAEVEADILARTDGVPLFVEEMGRAVMEGGLLREEADRWVLDRPMPHLAVPASLQASLVARLDRLGAVVREVAQAGAVLGREFAHDLLAVVAGLPEPALCTALDAFVAVDLAQRRGTPPEAVYAFRHALLRDAAHETLLRERRRELHRRAAEAIARLRPDAVEREPEVLAHHHAEAGEALAAIALYQHAGERATVRWTFHEARAHFTCALDLLPSVLDVEAARRLEAGLLIGLGTVGLAATGLGSTESGRAFGRAVELCRALGEGAPLAQALWGLWAHRLHVGDLLDALELAQESLEVARRAGSEQQLARSYAALGSTQQFLAHTDPAHSSLKTAVSGEGTFHANTAAVSSGAMAGPMLGRVLAAMGALDQSAAVTWRGVQGAREAGHLHSLANALTGACTTGFLLRDSQLFRASVREATELTETQGLPTYAMRAQAYIAWIAVEEGRLDEGTHLLVQCLASFRQAGVTLHTSHFEAMLSDAHRLGGNADAALAHIDEALRISTHTGEAWFDADLHRRRGDVLLRLGDVDGAEDELRRALKIARSQSALLFELRAACDLARVWLDRDRVSEARDLLASVYAVFTEGFAFPDLVEARALLKKLGAAPGGGW